MTEKHRPKGTSGKRDSLSRSDRTEKDLYGKAEEC